MLVSPDQNVSKDFDLPKFGNDYKKVIGEENITAFKCDRNWDYGMTFEYGEFTSNDVVLDIGGGFSYFMVYLSDFIQHGIIVDNVSFTWPRPTFWDWYKTLFSYKAFIQGKLSILIWNAVSLPFENNFFDKVVSFSALEHFGKGEDTKAVQEAYRVLKPGGYFTGTVDFNPKTEHPLVDGNPYTYTRKSFFERLIKPSGFELRQSLEPSDENTFQSSEDIKKHAYVSSLFFKLVKRKEFTQDE